MEACICVLSKFPDLFERFRSDLEIYEPDVPKILVRDGNLIPVGLYPEYYPGFDWTVIDGEQPFVYSRNVNIGWQASGTSDVILCGDDIRFSSTFVQELQRVAYLDEAIGIATVQLWGQSPFVCGYFKREIINAVGPMDERFTGYGMDDKDWCRRMEALGFRTQPVDTIKASHVGGTSFFRRAAAGGVDVQSSNDLMIKLYEEKWQSKTP